MDNNSNRFTRKQVQYMVDYLDTVEDPRIVEDFNMMREWLKTGQEHFNFYTVEGHEAAGRELWWVVNSVCPQED